MMPALGQHDTGMDYDLTAHDLLGYYMYWHVPLNGPDLKLGEPNTRILPLNNPTGLALIDAAAPNFPRTAHYSFDWGNSHWTVLDSAEHVDWNDQDLRKWLADDLAYGKSFTWRFAMCYLSMFHSGTDFQRQKMRVIADLIQDASVDLVFGGSHHSYQRTQPLRFYRHAHPDGPIFGYDTVIEGRYELDDEFDGDTHRRPKGVIYVTTGTGGNGLSNPEQTDKPATWQPFTKRYIADRYSFTLLDVGERDLRLRQIGADGSELDRITIEKSKP
jgi:hypothetical protein